MPSPLFFANDTCVNRSEAVLNKRNLNSNLAVDFMIGIPQYKALHNTQHALIYKLVQLPMNTKVSNKNEDEG